MERIRSDQYPPNAPPTSQQRLTTLLTQGDDSHEQLLPTSDPSNVGIDERFSSKTRPNPYNVGVWANWRQLLGPHPWLWWTPIETPISDGIHYAVNPKAWAELQGMIQYRSR